MPQTSTQLRNADRLRRATFPPDLDLSFGEAAVAKGYLTPDRLEECRRHRDRLDRRGISLSIGSILLKRRDLTVEQYLDVLAAQEAVEPAAVPRSPEGPPRFVLGKYRIIRELGRGGMGIVYEARDSQLQRRVALKVLQPQDPPSSRSLDRFRREATIGAKLQHPNIVRVQEFGAARDARGRQVHYLAMEYLEGQTLARVLAEGTTPEKDLLRILEDVGRAVACAHRMGVIHRDLKPSNVIVQPSGRPVLMDFGASQAEDLETRLTTSGVVIGTPACMAPEQVRGEPGRIDARTDVYALGVMLYEVLTGRPPFGDEPPPLLLHKILTEDPVPPRRCVATVDPRLELIALKSMEKDPVKRYPSAQEWVEDLARYRRGMPIEARPEGRSSRWSRGRALVFLAALLAIAAVAFFEMRRGVRPAEAHYRLGRLNRSLLNDEAAFLDQERALACEPGYAPALYERAVLTSRLHGKRVDEITEEYWRDEVDAQTAPVLSRQALARSDARALDLRKRQKADLDALGDSAALSPGERLCARGLLAWTAGDLSQAKKFLTEALERAPALEEACEALAMLEREQRRTEESIRWFTWGLERDPGYLPFREGRAFARFLQALELSNGGGPAEEEFAAAAADYAAVLKKDRRALLRSGVMHMAWAFQRARSGRDPGELFAESIREFDQVAELRDLPKSRLWRGLARTLWGLCTATVPAWGASDGGDPRALSAAAIDDFSALIDGPAAPDAAWMWRGAAFIVQGIVQTSRLADPTGSYERALGDLGEAIRRNPARDEAWMWRGVARKVWAIREFLGGRDPRPAYESAMENFDEAIRRNPGRADSWTHRGEARVLWASFAMPSRGEDPFPVLTEAMRDLDESIRLNPSQWLVWSCRGSAKEGCGRLQAARRAADAKAWIGAALGDYEEAMRLNPDFAPFLSKLVDSCHEALRAGCRARAR